MAKGYFEIWENAVTGWVADLRGSAEVSLCLAGQPVQTAVAHLHRPDVEAVGAGGAYCGFQFNLLPGASLDVLIQAVSVKAKLPGEEEFDVVPADGILEARSRLQEQRAGCGVGKTLLDERQKVAVGNGGWLFLVNDSNRARDHIEGTIRAPDTDVAAWRNLLHTRKLVCRWGGSTYVPAIIPDKYVVAGEHAVPPCRPNPDRLAVKLAQNGDAVYLLDRMAMLMEAGCDPYFQTDTHWNDFACLDVALWARSLWPGGTVGEYEYVAYDLMGDLGEKLDDPKPELVLGIRPACRNASVVSSELSVSGSEIRQYRSEASGHVMLVATSAASQLEGFLAELFGRTTVCISSCFPASLVESMKPDLVLNLMTERTMLQVQNDCFFSADRQPATDSRFERYLNRWNDARPVSVLERGR